MEDLYLITFFKGFALSLGLIIAIGPQNVYVLRKGLMGRHILTVVLTCFFADMLLLLLASGGVGAMLNGNQNIAHYAAYGGGAFLFWFGLRSFMSAKNPQIISQQDVQKAGLEAQGKGPRAAIMMCLALTFLNPHIYVDTLIIIGGVSAQYHGMELVIFAVGTIMASAMWFFSIGYGARILAPVFQSPKAWRILDSGVGLLMWAMSYYLISGHFMDGH